MHIFINNILDIIYKTKIKYSRDYNNFNMLIIKYIKSGIAPLISHLFNRCLSEGIFHDVLKIAKVLLLYKKNNKNYCQNYRPISLLP